MATRMQHEDHGYHIAYGAEEIARMQKDGWKLDPEWDKTVLPKRETLTLKKPK